jgi:hypothetical protein
MYFVRINTNNINPLIKESLNVNKSLHDEGFYTWYTLALNVFQEFDLDAVLIKEAIGSRPNSDNVEMLHAVFLRPKTVLQYFVCIFSYDDFSCRAKVSRLPIASFIKTQVMMYFVRMNTNNINPLIKECLNVNKSLHDESFYTWYTLALNVFQEFDFYFQ